MPDTLSKQLSAHTRWLERMQHAEEPDSLAVARAVVFAVGLGVVLYCLLLGSAYLLLT